MKHIASHKAQDTRSASSRNASRDFKAEVALIVKELGNRLDKLLDQHEECLLKASCSSAHGEAHKKNAGSACLDSDTEFPMAPAPMAKHVVFPSLPGCPEPPPRAPMMLDTDPDGMEMGKAHMGQPSSFTSLPETFVPSTSLDSKDMDTDNLREAAHVRGRKASVERSIKMLRRGNTAQTTISLAREVHEIVGRAIWTDEPNDSQKAAIERYDGSFRLRLPDPTATTRGILRLRGRTAHFEGTKMASSSKRTERCKFEVLHPAGSTRTLWNCASLILICSDALTVPLLAFDIGDTWPWEVFAWFCTLFWTADVFVSFRTGYFEGPKVELRYEKVARHYVRTWLSFDLFIVLFEWFSRFYSSLGPSGVVRTTRVVRGVRLVKLLRITKMKGLLTEFSQRLNSNILSLIFDVFLLTTLLCAVGHFVTCVWYALGKSTSDGWIHTDLYAAEQGIDDMSSLYWYLSSARWVISQFNGRTDMNEKRNMSERMFTVLAGVILSVVARSVFVALITKSVLQLSELYKKTEERRRNVNDYLRMHPVPTTVERSVKAHAHEYQDMDVERQREGIVLALLPKHLQKDLVHAARKPLLTKQPLFRVYLRGGFDFAARHVIFDVVKQRHTIGEEMVFKALDPCSRMLIADTGTLIYGLEKRSSWKVAVEDEEDMQMDLDLLDTTISTKFKGAAAVIRVTHGMWVSEPAIWATWTNKGTLTTEDNCCMLEVDGNKFGSALQQHTDLFGLAVVYSKQYLRFLRQEPLLSDVLTLDVQYEYDQMD